MTGLHGRSNQRSLKFSSAVAGPGEYQVLAPSELSASAQTGEPSNPVSSRCLAGQVGVRSRLRPLAGLADRWDVAISEGQLLVVA
jgi:hypothetical protein